MGASSHQFYVRPAVGRKDSRREQANSHPIRPGQNYQRNPLVSSTTRRQGQRGCRPFPLHPQSPPDLLRFASDHLSRTISLDEAEHFLAQSSRQRRFAPTAVHLHSGTPFGLPPESMFTFTGIPIQSAFPAPTAAGRLQPYRFPSPRATRRVDALNSSSIVTVVAVLARG